MAKSLLIISCSGSKNKSNNKRKAIDRYTGVYYKVIKKLIREHNFPDRVDIIIISAKYGLLQPDDLIDYYEQRMSERRAGELHEAIVTKLSHHLNNYKYDEILINLGREYLLSVEGFQQYITPETKVTFVSGRIGERMKVMKEWLLSKT